MKQIVVILLGLLLILFSASVSAHTVQEDNFEFDVNGGDDTSYTDHTNQDKNYDPHTNQDSVDTHP